ncbi:uncharacterized protein LOC130549069 isoform X2 [Triplophysa rosa]|uniref:uncharacterized protein LOC130549069 isoform X2 n=1 Tax=Triplophysa rosa TaxID=992332 RepID=UPI002546359F|nr:uncharacterized protein LOC130549069 isoform X2 [Triplophysa rosa]
MFSHTLLQNMICVMVLLRLCLCHLTGVFGVDPDEVKSVMEGHSVTLHTDTELHTHDVIEWMFGVQSPDEIIAELNREANITSFINERLKNHVEIDAQTGSLIITNITTQHTGLYKAEITRKSSVVTRHFKVTVYEKSYPELWFTNHKHQLIVISCTVGPLMIVAAVLTFWICSKHRQRQQDVAETVQTSEEEITYADPTFCQRQKHTTRCAVEDDVVYAGVMRR